MQRDDRPYSNFNIPPASGVFTYSAFDQRSSYCGRKLNDDWVIIGFTMYYMVHEIGWDSQIAGMVYLIRDTSGGFHMAYKIDMGDCMRLLNDVVVDNIGKGKEWKLDAPKMNARLNLDTFMETWYKFNRRRNDEFTSECMVENL